MVDVRKYLLLSITLKIAAASMAQVIPKLQLRKPVPSLIGKDKLNLMDRITDGSRAILLKPSLY